SALYETKARPEMDVAVIEREFAGFGASGRNGGWMSAEPVGPFSRYAADRGVEAARLMQKAMFGAVREAIEVAQREGFGDAVSENGLIHIATSRAGLNRVKRRVKSMWQQGWGVDDVYELTAAEVR